MTKQRLLIIQPAIPLYRVPFFERLRESTVFKIIASNMDENDVVSRTDNTSFESVILDDVKKIKGVVFQRGVLKYILQLQRGDVLVINGNPRYIVNVLAAMLVKLKGVKIIWWGQVWSANTTNNSFRVKRWVMRFFNAVLVYNDQEASLLKKYLGDKVFSINNGINNKDISILRKEYDVSARAGNVLYIGRLTEKSNFSFLIEALDRVSNITLHVIGNSTNREDIYKPDSNVKVIFHGELNDENKISNVANKCLFFIYPGAVGLSLLHAFNYGLPALIHNKKHKHMPEANLFEERVNGVSFQCDDISDLASKIMSLNNHEYDLGRMSINAISACENDYNTEAMVGRFLGAINSV
ncbi:glycosyltransferase [uncultured Kushneria sp.]|uniref:glycosyltransferase n=1 Tax=uncultured Kushneria sp. TaxID=905033 RepID=UPI002609D18A|nr:glycosyltransferase [uncultured Kushneria sp.]